MAGASFQIQDRGFDQAIQTIDGIENLDEFEMLDGIGRLLQESTRNRIEVTKQSPDGESWKANIEGSSILHKSGALAASIDYAVGGSQVEIGTGLVYALIHQMGGTIKPKSADKLVFMIGNRLVFATKVNIPQREYLGASAQDKTDILEMLTDVILGTLQ